MSLIPCVYSADPEPSVQEQALALVRNFVDGCVYSVEHAFAEDGIILDAVGRQLKKSTKIESEGLNKNSWNLGFLWVWHFCWMRFEAKMPMPS